MINILGECPSGHCNNDPLTTSQAIVRDVCKNAFDIDKDSAFVHHTPSLHAIVKVYNLQQDTVGPNPHDLRLDPFYETKFRWNKSVHDILLQRVQEKLRESYPTLPVLSERCILSMVQSKCETLIKTWNAAQVRPGETGVDAAGRWAEQKRNERKAAR